tara:strand:- start:242 stop:475 length:234 start_codon:yes stop_codon:yes gene_type:complete
MKKQTVPGGHKQFVHLVITVRLGKEFGVHLGNMVVLKVYLIWNVVVTVHKDIFAHKEVGWQLKMNVVQTTVCAHLAK